MSLLKHTWAFTSTASPDSDVRPRIVRNWSYQATVTGSGAVSGTVLIEVRNIPGGTWTTWGTLTLSGTDSASDYLVGDAPWLEHRARCTAISGTSASISVIGAGAN